MKPQVQAFFDKTSSTISYIVYDPSTKKAAIIDPVLDFTPRNANIATKSAQKLLDFVQDQNLEILYILETHAHADHLSAAHHLRALTGAKIIIGAGIKQVQTHFGVLFEAHDIFDSEDAFDQLVDEGDILQLGGLDINIIHTPGHTPACVTYHIGDAAFTGDTLFMPDYGTARTDFPGGSAQKLYQSIQKIYTLPNETRIFVGHDYLPEGRTEYCWESSVKEQRNDNIHINSNISEEEFVQYRTNRDAGLSAPQMILPSLQVNIRGGAMPPPSQGGHVYLRLPVNAI